MKRVNEVNSGCFYGTCNNTDTTSVAIKIDHHTRVSRLCDDCARQLINSRSNAYQNTYYLISDEELTCAEILES